MMTLGLCFLVCLIWIVFALVHGRKVKGLGEESGDELDNAAMWVQKNRKEQKEKEMAEKRVSTAGFVQYWKEFDLLPWKVLEL